MLRLRSGRPSRSLVACALFAGALACCSAPSRAAVFTPGLRFSLATGTRPYGLAVADLDRDGVPDLVTVNNSGITVAVLKGAGGGAYAAPVEYPVGTSPFALAVGDLNDDLRPDVVVANSGANTVSVLLGNGDGTLAPQAAFDTRLSPQALALADFNRDGKLDVAVACNGSNTVSVHLGDGRGRLGSRLDLAVGSGPVQIAAGDLDGDGAPDLAVTSRDVNAAIVLLGYGDGRFQNPVSYTVGARPAGIAISDVTRDGRPDLLVANNSSGTLSLLPGIGGGLFGVRTDVATGSTPIGVCTGDLDGNGTADVCVTLSGAGAIGVFPVSLAGVLGARLDVSAGATPRAVIVADLDGSGLPDLATVNTTANTVTVLSADEPSRFRPPVFQTSTPGHYRSAQVAADLDGDGLLDRVTSSFAGPVVYLGDVLGAFHLGTLISTYQSFASLAAGDLNHDRWVDVVGVLASGDSVGVLLNDGSGHLLAPVLYALPANTQSTEVAVADANRDGHPDVLVTSPGTNAVLMLPGTGSGALGTRVAYGVGGSPQSLCVTDLNTDGRIDVITGTSTGMLSVLPGAAIGFAAHVDVPSVGSLQGLSSGDLNGDGKPDVVGWSKGPDSLFVSLNDGAGNLGTPRFLTPLHYDCAHVELADLNGDGRLDLAWANNQHDPTTFVDMSTVATMLGDGAGGFTARHDLENLVEAHHVLAADVNGDGRPDLLVAPKSWNRQYTLLARQPMRLSLSDAPAPTLPGTAFTLTASVTPAWPGVAPAMGMVRFYRGETFLGQSRIANSVATWPASDPGAGRHEFRATYAGDTSSLGAQSLPLVHRVLASAKPVIASIKDVTRDEGRQVRLRVSASPFDAPAVTTPIVRYDVLRRIDATLLLAARAAAVRTPAPGAAPASVAMEGWDVVGTFSATGDSVYHLVVPTVVDSNASGIHRATFFVRAITSTPTVYYDSPADSGWSVDNLPPPTPAPFTAAYVSGATRLHWGASGAADFAYYRLYRGASADFVPAPGSLIAARADTGWVDPGDAGAWYKLSAVDVNGNESVCAMLGPDGTVDTPSPAPGALRLRAASPNPARDATTLRFTLPAATRAALAIFDASGRRVRTLASGERGAGEHALAWDLRDDAGRAVGAGLWFARLDADGEHRVVRFATLR